MSRGVIRINTYFYNNSYYDKGIANASLKIRTYSFGYASWGPATISINVDNYYDNWRQLTSNNIFIEHVGGTQGAGSGAGCEATGTYDNTTGEFSFYLSQNSKQNKFILYIITIE